MICDYIHLKQIAWRPIKLEPHNYKFDNVHIDIDILLQNTDDLHIYWILNINTDN